MFGPAPRGRILLTHDVDAVRKTSAIRIKQAAFHCFNALRRAASPASRSRAGESLRRASTMLFRRESYFQFAQIASAERLASRRSIFNVCAPGQPRRWLMDPSYDIESPRLRRTLSTLHLEGWGVGVHPSYDAWRDPAEIRGQMERIAAAIGHRPVVGRQHWLRFSWRDTWRAQERAGLQLDSTAGFNDRPGFRLGSALVARPWLRGSTEGPADTLQVVPMVLMDSHLHDYGDLDQTTRHDAIRGWMSEVAFVGGAVSVVWHQRVFGNDYGWGESYHDLLGVIEELGLTDLRLDGR